MEMKLKSRIMDKDQMERTTHRMAHEILEQNRGSANICLVGIRSRGVPLADRLSKYLKLIEEREIPVGLRAHSSILISKEPTWCW